METFQSKEEIQINRTKTILEACFSCSIQFRLLDKIQNLTLKYIIFSLDMYDFMSPVPFPLPLMPYLLCHLQVPINKIMLAS